MFDRANAQAASLRAPLAYAAAMTWPHPQGSGQ
jgi:hypothetical protein